MPPETENRIAIIDYGAGNLQSVMNAIVFIGGSPYLAEKPEQILSASHVILPGVGAFKDGMGLLNENNWIPSLTQFAITQKKPLLGICLGMQLLASYGEEDGHSNGLGYIKGSVTKMKSSASTRIPHIGWNDVTKSNSCKSYENIEDNSNFYFVHSYAFTPENNNVISGKATHGSEFVASIEQDNIWGVQFHPEKSHKSGLQLLRNFIES